MDHPDALIIDESCQISDAGENFRYSATDKAGNIRGIITSDTHLNYGQSIHPSDLTRKFDTAVGTEYHYTPRNINATTEPFDFDAGRALVL
jgi:hypothetical protein